MSDKPVVVVTGCGGFLGSHLLNGLKAREVDVIGVDKTGGAGPGNSSCAVTAADFMSRDGLTGLKKDLDKVKGRDLYLVHLLGIPDIGTCEADKALAYDINVRSVEIAWELAEERAMKKVIFPSTAMVYGTKYADPVNEDIPPFPENVYARSKLEAENFLVRSSVGSKVATVILRLSNIYGAAMSKNTVIYTILEQLAAGHLKLREYSSIRDYVYIEDAVNALILSMFSECPSKLYNVGSSSGRSVLDLATVIAKAVHKEEIVSKIRLSDEELECGSKLVLCCDRIKSDLGWKPAYDLERGIQRMKNG